MNSLAMGAAGGAAELPAYQGTSFQWQHLHLKEEVQECSQKTEAALITGNTRNYLIVQPHLKYSPVRDILD